MYPVPNRNMSSNIFLIVISTLLTLFVLEIGFRVMAYSLDKKLENVWRTIGLGINKADQGQHVKIKHIIQHSDNPHIIYELVPNLNVIFKNRPLRINGNGFRGREIDTQPSDGIRIAGIGDSVMFGWGVSDSEYYLAIFEQLLQKAYPQCNWEIINSAVPGYNTVMEVETLKEKLLPLKPDIVIIGFVGNDLSLPNYIKKKDPYLRVDRSFLWTFVKARLKGIERGYDIHLVGAPDHPYRDGFENNPQRVPDEYRAMVGINAYRRAMEELKSLSKQHNFKVIVFCISKFPEEIHQIISKLGFPLIEGFRVRDAFMSKNGRDKYIGSALTLGVKDTHPSPLHHKLLAQELFNYMRDNQLLRKQTHDSCRI